MASALDQKPAGGWRRRMHEVVFESDTPAGWAFDVMLIVAILASVAAVILESVAEIRANYGTVLTAAEWGFTLLFTVEYITRLACVRRPARYANHSGAQPINRKMAIPMASAMLKLAVS